MKIFNVPGAVTLLTFLAASVSWSAGLPDSLVIVPKPDGDFATIDEQNDPLEKCPKYTTDHKSQILSHNGWEGKDDYHAEVRFALTGGELIGRIDVTDDLTRIDPMGRKGDRIAIRLATYTCGPIEKRPRDNPYDEILLFPQPTKGACTTKIKALDKRSLGKVKTSLFASLDGYSIIIRIPTTEWEKPPSFGGQVRCQVQFYDADDKVDPTIDNHSFSLFRVPRAARNGELQVRHFGQLKFVKKTWARLTAESVIFEKGKVAYRGRWGNLGDEPEQVEISIKNGPKSWSVAGEPRTLEPGTTESDVEVILDLKEVPTGKKYDVKSAIGRLFETSSHPFDYRGSLSYCYKEHGIQAPRKGRAVSAVNAAETVRAIAGGGTVLWRAGAYDGTGADQQIKIWDTGPHEIKVGAAATQKVPFALFGGSDPIDGMNEPLVLKLDASLKSKDALSPATLTGDKYNKALSKKSRLLLIGLATDFVNDQEFPEIVVRAGTKELIRQKLKTPAEDGVNARHVHVLRVWLEDRQTELEIENVATFGPRAEIDFIALVGGGKDFDFPLGAPALRFSGTNSAEIYTRQLATSLYFMRNYLVDRNGQTFSSLPGGRYGNADAAEFGFLMSELSRWGATDTGKRMLDQMGRSRNNLMQLSRLGGASVGQMETVSALCQLWKYSDRDSQILQRIWISYVLRTINSMERELSTNPLGLPNSPGEFGINGKRKGATTPMFAATAAALKNAATVAKNSGYSQSAAPLERTLAELERNFRRTLIVEDRDVQLASAKPFPKSWSVPAGPVIGLLGKGNLVYGRYEDRKPILYNDNIRVFDTPYLFSSLSLLSEAGQTLNDDFRSALKVSYDFQQVYSPLARQTARRTYGIIDYKSLTSHHWSTMAELQLDNLNVASRSIEMLIAASFDEGLPLPVDRDVLPSSSVSPYLPGEQINLASNGNNLGMTGDEMNIMIGTHHLRLARMIAGLDDADPDQLKLTPRLPEKWNQASLSNWKVSSNSGPNGVAKVDCDYQRVGANRYSLNLRSDSRLKSITVRIGPFDVLTRTVRVSGTGGSSNVTPVKEGLYTWVTKTFENTSNVKITAQAR